MANKVIAGAVTDGQYERFEVYTGQQACALLNVSHVSTITARARTAAAKDNRTVVWLATAPGNTTSVNLFVAAWVDELVARNGGAKVKVRPVVMYLPRLLGMTDAAVSTTEPPSLPGEVVAPTPGPSPSRHPTADPLQDPANQLDLVRSEAAAERQARGHPGGLTQGARRPPPGPARRTRPDNPVAHGFVGSRKSCSGRVSEGGLVSAEQEGHWGRALKFAVGIAWPLSVPCRVGPLTVNGRPSTAVRCRADVNGAPKHTLLPRTGREPTHFAPTWSALALGTMPATETRLGGPVV